MRQMISKTMLLFQDLLFPPLFTTLSITGVEFITSRLGRARLAKGRQELHTKGAAGLTPHVPAAAGKGCMGLDPEGWMVHKFTDMDFCDA